MTVFLPVFGVSCRYTRYVVAIITQLFVSKADVMIAKNAKKVNPIDHLPDELHPRLKRDLGTENIRAAAAFDLDGSGKYIEGYLVLTANRLGQYVRSDDQWESRWLGADTFDEAKLIEGLGMGLLRLLSGGERTEEFRFTRRHAKAMARLHRQLERQIEGKTGEADAFEETKRPDEKKLRCEKCGQVIPAWSETCPACTSRRKILFRLLDYVKPYKVRVAAAIALAATILAAQLAQPWLRKPMIDKGLGMGEGDANWQLFVFFWGLWGALILFSSGLQAIQIRVQAKLGAYVGKDLRGTVYEHLHKLSLSFFGKKRTGSLVTRVTSDTERLYDFVSFTVVEVVMALLTIIGVAALMFSMHWQLACFVLMPVPLMIGLTIFFHKRLHRVFMGIWHRWSQMTSVVASALPGVRVIKAFGQEQCEADRFESKSHNVFEAEMSAINIWTTFGPVMRFCTQIGMLVIWLLGGLWTIRDFGVDEPGMTLGTMMAFTGYMQMFYRPIHMIAHMDRMFNRAATSAQRVFEVLDTEPAIFSQAEAKEAHGIRGAIELRNVSFSYDGVRNVLKHINLKIAPGEMMGLAGPSGGGKTTMINLICRFYDVMEGEILIDGVDIRSYKVEELRRRIGVVLQDPFLFPGTVAENIAYGHPDVTMDHVLEASKAANAHDFITAFPDGYDTIVGERGHSLSGGERQRISISRAILGNPSVLILDEATSSVDSETERLIQEALDHLIANRTTIAIAHRLSTLYRASRLAILEKGDLVEEGTHQELLAKPDGLYAKLVRTQSELQALMTG